ncbi:hypothetical protein FQN51_002360 [Onygenales sp. PD_10]|nr:hypothetical protein FQN51_002360 [Onygenales sp. PD_10]
MLASTPRRRHRLERDIRGLAGLGFETDEELCRAITHSRDGDGRDPVNDGDAGAG